MIHSNIIREIKRNKLEKLFHFSEKPTGTLEIECIENGNKFLTFDIDDNDTLIRLDNPTDIFVEDLNTLTFEQFGFLLTRLRNTVRNPQFTGTFNNCDVDNNHWLKRFIFNDEIPEGKNNKILRFALDKKKIVKHRSLHSYNEKIDINEMEGLFWIKSGGNEELYEKYLRGLWKENINK